MSYAGLPSNFWTVAAELQHPTGPPYKLKRFPLTWAVVQQDPMSCEFKYKRHFFRKESAVAHLVQKQLEGEKVKWT